MESTPSALTSTITAIVRLLGLLMLIVGLYAGIKVILEAWNLYDEPQRIERFATAIEQGSNIDSLLTSLTTPVPQPQPIQTELQDGDATMEKSTPSVTPSQTTKPNVRMTYFLAWGIVVLLLMVIGGLASSAIRTGGQLALYDLQVKQFAQQLINEARKQP